MDTRCDLSRVSYDIYDGVTYGDAGTVSPEGIRNDCTVVSLAVVADLPYDLCYRLLESHGYQKNKGVYWHPFVWYGPFKWRASLRKTTTIRRFARTHPAGSYVCLIRRKASRDACHVVALVDGVVYDCADTSPQCRVHFAWRYEGLKKKYER